MEDGKILQKEEIKSGRQAVERHWEEKIIWKSSARSLGDGVGKWQTLKGQLFSPSLRNDHSLG